MAWEHAGRPSMAIVGDRVGYSKATISKVLSGKMPPAWRLVQKLGQLLHIPQATITGQWHPLWIAADRYRRTVADLQPETGKCEACGSWIGDWPLHRDWHSRMDHPAHHDPHPWATLRDALGPREK
jgi:transcriptional regulator with XRE-family HTH domain